MSVSKQVKPIPIILIQTWDWLVYEQKEYELQAIGLHWLNLVFGKDHNRSDYLGLFENGDITKRIHSTIYL